VLLAVIREGKSAIANPAGIPPPIGSILTANSVGRPFQAVENAGKDGLEKPSYTSKRKSQKIDRIDGISFRFTALARLT
jgi:hypothetical protein